MGNRQRVPREEYEAHFRTLLRRVARRRSPSLEMAWLFQPANTLPVLPDYLEFGQVGRKGVERLINRSLYRLAPGLWFRGFWPLIRKGLASYMRETYFPIFFAKTARTPRMEAEQAAALEAVESFLTRSWPDLGHCTFTEVGVMVNEVLQSCYRFLECPPDLFKDEKQRQNRACLDFLAPKASALASHPRQLEFLLYAACQANWMDSLEGDAFAKLDQLARRLERALSRPEELDALAGPSPYYQLERLRALLEGGPARILYECDNSGEIVFDLLLVGWLLQKGHRVVLGAKAGPAINDITVPEVEELLAEELFAPLALARRQGRLSLLPIASVMGGKLLYEADHTYQQAFGQADLVFLKGQGNFQSMPMGKGRGSEFTPYLYKKPLVFLMPLKSVMSRLCLDSILTRPLPDRSMFLFCFDPSDPTTYP